MLCLSIKTGKEFHAMVIAVEEIASMKNGKHPTETKP